MCACRLSHVQASDVEETLVPSIVHEVLRSPGQPLDPATRAFMEMRFGRDLSQVRVHADSQAERSTQAIQARAYTVGRNIVFGAGEYAAYSQAGRSLLAHELTHIVQQGAASGLLQRDPKPGAEDEPCPWGQMRLGADLPCVPITLPGRDCPVGQLRFGGECVPFRQRPTLFDTKLHLDPTLRPRSASSSGTSARGGTATGTTSTTGQGGTTKGCKYSVTYANPKEVDCDTVWRAQKGKAPPGPLCGKQVIFEIVSVSVSPSSCPLEGLEVSENVATVPDAHRCTPPDFVWPPPTPCKIGPGGKVTGCTDTLTICGLTSDLHFGGCEEVVTQDILVDGKPVEKHTITFELDVRGTNCTGTVTRK